MLPNGSKIRRGETPQLGVACENPLLDRRWSSSLFCVRTHRFKFSANRKTTQNRTQRFRYIDLPLSIRHRGVTRSYSLITDVTVAVNRQLLTFGTEKVRIKRLRGAPWRPLSWSDLRYSSISGCFYFWCSSTRWLCRDTSISCRQTGSRGGLL
jgi:hypothetical protein